MKKELIYISPPYNIMSYDILEALFLFENKMSRVKDILLSYEHFFGRKPKKGISYKLMLLRRLGLVTSIGRGFDWRLTEFSIKNWLLIKTLKTAIEENDKPNIAKYRQALAHKIRVAGVAYMGPKRGSIIKKVNKNETERIRRRNKKRNQ